MAENEKDNLQTEGKPSTEVVGKPKRRTFTAKYKLRMLREAEACKGSGEIGATTPVRRPVFLKSHGMATTAGAR